MSARILSLALSVAMVTTMLPMTAFAAEGDAPLGASTVGTIQSFDKLGDRFIPAVGKDAPDHVYGLSVEPNTPVEDLNLPDELTAMVARTATVSAPAEDEPVVDSGKPSEPAVDETIPDEDTVVDDDTATDETVSDNQPATPSDAEEVKNETTDIKDGNTPLAPEPVVDSGKPSEPAVDETIPDEDTVVEGDTATDETVPDNQPVTPSDAEEVKNETTEIKDGNTPLASEPEQDEETLATTVEQETIPVTWQSDKEYKSDENGQFIYTAVLPEGYTLADGVNLPQIYVAVGKQARNAGKTQRTAMLNLKEGFTVTWEGGSGDPTQQDLDALAAEGWKWDYQDRILTIDGLDVSLDPSQGSFAVYLPNDSTVILSDGSTNRITCKMDSTNQKSGLAGGGLTLKTESEGTGTLTISTVLGGSCIAGGMGALNIQGGTYNLSAPNSDKAIKTGTFNMSGGELTASARNAAIDIGVTGKAGMIITAGDASPGASVSAYTNEKWVHIKIIPVITIGTQPTTPAAMTYGSITGRLTVAGTASNSNPVSYQWYKNTTNSATGGTAITGATSASFTIPTTLNAGTYYYYCVFSATGCPDKASDVATVTVNKASATEAMKTVAATVSKNGATGATATLPAKPAAATYGTITYSGTITCSNATVNGDTLTYTAPASAVGATGAITIPVTTATNYNDYNIVVTITSTDKKAATITASVADKTYNGVAVTQPAPTAVEKDTTTPVTLTYTYKWQKSNGSGGYTDISGNTAPKDAGSYKLVIDGSNDTHAGTKEIAFTISKATVTITADNKSAYVGDAKPTLTYTAAGLASGDTLATVPTLTYESEPDMSKAGSVKIKASGAVVPNTDNYESAITYVDSTLTISNKSSGGGGGGLSSGGSSTTPPTKPTEPVKGESNTTATVDKNGNATTTVTDKNIADAVKAAKDAASKKGVNAGEITAVINVTAPANSNPNTVTVNLPKTVQQQVIGNKIDNVAIVIDKPDISIGMNLATITEMNKQANADIALSATRTDATKLSAEAKNAIGNRPAFDLKATYNGGAKSITSFGTGSVSVAIPYTLQAGEIAGGLYAVYIDGNGKANYITVSSYDANTKMLRFATNHFSVYGIGYKAPVGFTDIAGHWSKTDIEFVVNRGLMSGTSNTTFAPNGSMTRGMFVTALGRLAGVDTNSYKTGKFTDVKADAYYAPYVNWAASKGITNGTTATTFSPDSTVTRQEMAVFMSNYAKAMGYKVPEAREAVTFADNGSIGSWAAAAVKQMQMAGVLNGKNSNKFDPTGTATRAEVAAVLHRYVELVIDRTTAQGLDTNDSGSAMMYENGKAVKSASRTVGSSTYNFNANGEAALLPANNKKTGTYTVKKGDSFWLIAKKVGCTMADLEQLNGKNRNDSIYAGQTLKVPQK